MRNQTQTPEPEKESPVRITSYGVLHGPAPTPDAALVEVDLSAALRNPHHDPSMKYKTGLDEDVRKHVLSTDGAAQIIDQALGRVSRALETTTPVEVHTFCRGGRHRSVAIAEEIAERLRDQGVQVEVVHRDVDKPVVQA